MSICPKPVSTAVTLRSAVLQQAVGKSAGGGAYIQARPALDGDLPMLERGSKLESAAAYIGHIVAQHADRRIRWK